ncbi:aminoglycoside phosphotransferase [Salipiger aestuarii]|uniref:Fructosamine-3-kinase n=1 Tax=Salipiger aestuarii TaxID=568098 RepID=A0A327XRX6_9RHOB|nr:fructosamine kinase family protein [Salipiger aestuarii]KAB2540560.1 aminoglycoside phosphotransferase [Salipiger aestuarii]RAK11012.1 fructosamine-3-kinase [Salipiger aestuarii]
MTLQGLSRFFGSDVVATRPLHGGDLSEVVRMDLSDGTRVAVKRGPLVGIEADMLRRMASAGAPVPRVLHQTGDLLCLEWLGETPASPAGWGALGTGLRTLHAARGDHYGWPCTYGFGRVTIRNTPMTDWPRFWAECRLLPFLPALPPAMARRVEALARALPERLPATPAPALLHGDLWIGNALFSGSSAYLIDPACYYGDAEVDLAMLDLFSTPTQAFHDAYGAGDPARAERRPIYQLFPALVHYRLFGASYQGLVARLVQAARI